MKPPEPAPPPIDRDHRDVHGDRDHHEMPAPQMGDVRHHEWKLDRPVISNYWPAKGKAGTHVRIQGQNFPTNAVVAWNNDAVAGATVSPTEIRFTVPPGATSGSIALRIGHGHDVAVGTFEVATYDAEAEARKIEEARRKAAEQAWNDRRKSMATDRAAREAALKQRQQELETTREHRRDERLAAIRAKWERAFLADEETQAELTLHAQRVARIERMREIAEQNDNGKLVVRIDVMTSRENERHDQRMVALHGAFQPK
jgi:hypothetical protein